MANQPSSSGIRAIGGGTLATYSRESVVPVARKWALHAAGYGLPFALVLYLGLRGGGYDSVVRGEVGVAVWWVVAIGAAVGALPASRISRIGWVFLGLLAGFAAWTALAVGWSESSERTVTELGRVSVYLGAFVLVLAAQREDALKRAIYGVATAIAVLGILALLSRLHPAWFPANEGGEFLAESQRRLNYPLNYWNGLAALIAIGLPLLIWIASSARYAFTRCLAAAAVPALILAGFFTLSRGGAIEGVVAVGALLALHPRRLSLMPTIAVTGLGAGLAIAAGSQRDALAHGLANEAATAQADEMTAIICIICAGVALLQVAVALAARYGVGPRIHPRPSTVRRNTVIAVVAAAVVAILIGVPGQLADAWEEFKSPVGPERNSATRFDSANGNGRYQWWASALDANATAPLTGIGPGTFEFWWSREGTLPGFVRDAHSLYLETLAELGIIGLLLIVALIAGALGVGITQALRAPPERRAMLAAATAGILAFATAAAIDWGWELAVLPVAFLILTAGITASDKRPGALESTSSPRFGVGTRVVLGGLAIAGLVAVILPLAGTASVRASQDAVNAAQLGPALDEADSARDIQPYAATPSLQQALVLELAGEFDAAAAAAREATQEEPTNWRTWLVLSRLEVERGNAPAAARAYREARSLNPRSPLFQ